MHKLINSQLLKHSAYRNGKRVIIVTPSPITGILLGYTHVIQPDGTLHPSFDGEAHTLETLTGFLSHYDTKKVNEHLELV